MLSIGVSNLRRLTNIEPIEIRPITLLVGRNSSGKSSFLRVMPLLRQSLMRRTSGPILWYGDLVDFGSFQEALTENADPKEMAFRFKIDQAKIEWTNRLRRFERMITEYEDLEIITTIGSAPPRTTRICNITVVCNHGALTYSLDLEDGLGVRFSINGQDIFDQIAGCTVEVQLGTIFPVISLSHDELEETRSFRPSDQILLRLVQQQLQKHGARGEQQPEKLEELAALILQAPANEGAVFLRRALEESGRLSPSLFEFALTDQDVLFGSLVNLLHLRDFQHIVEGTNESLRQTAINSLYIGPARARSERYYRYQELSVSEIDSDGNNFGMFLNSLSPVRLGRFSNWVESLFGYRIDLSRAEGHISIRLMEGESNVNIVDTGYGISQILPVLGQIWWAQNRPTGSFTQNRLARQGSIPFQILSIEQPELHLHPAHQALIADALVARARPQYRPPHITHFIVETHSETLINRLGELVESGVANPDDLQIVLFEPDSDDQRRTNSRIVRFGHDGRLVDWPYGFFHPEYK